MRSSAYPRLDHIRRHISARNQCSGSLDDAMAILPLLLEPLTQAEIAERLGMTLRVVSYHWVRIVWQLGLPTQNGPNNPARLALLRIALGLDPCFCEDREAVA